jgi:hypothetical protein
MIPIVYKGSDYASIEGKVQAYYGPNETDPDTFEWCMVVRKNGKEVFRRTNSELLAIAAGESPMDMLLSGLAIYLNKC